MNVAQLRAALETADPNAVVTCSPGGGVLDSVTATVNGFVILDAVPAEPRAATDRNPDIRA